MRSLFRFAHIFFVSIFQNGGLRHNNFINLILWKSRHIWSSINQSDIVLSLSTKIEKKTLFSCVSNFRNFIQNGFFSRFKRFFIFLLIDQSFWRKLWNRFNDQIRKDYFRLNIFFSNETFLMNNVNYMNKFRECVHFRSNNELECQKIAFVLLVSTLFFEFNASSIFINGKYYCQNSVKCRIRKIVLCEVLTRLYFAILIFMTKNKVLDYFEFDRDFCKNCHRYEKIVEFMIRHFTEFTILYLKNDFRGKKKSVNFFKLCNDLWLNSFWTCHSNDRILMCVSNAKNVIFHIFLKWKKKLHQMIFLDANASN